MTYEGTRIFLFSIAALSASTLFFLLGLVFVFRPRQLIPTHPAIWRSWPFMKWDNDSVRSFYRSLRIMGTVLVVVGLFLAAKIVQSSWNWIRNGVSMHLTPEIVAGRPAWDLLVFGLGMLFLSACLLFKTDAAFRSLLRVFPASFEFPDKTVRLYLLLIRVAAIAVAPFGLMALLDWMASL